MHSKTLKVGLLGCGNIGSKVAKELLTGKIPSLEFKRALVRDTKKDRGLPSEYLTSQPEDIFDDKDIDIVIEVMSGDNPVLEYALKSLNNKKHLVTANKELIAKHGPIIFETAYKNQVQVKLDATVCGGIPVINTLLDSLKANEIQEAVGILNGTTNYILSQMESGKDFNNALKDAQLKGYAEPDPTNDLEGYDTKYKISILASLCFQQFFAPDKLACDGIKNISSADFHFAHKWNFAIKLLGIARRVNNKVAVGVYPALISNKDPLSQINDVLNAVQIKGHLINELLLVGPGAGPAPTTSAILGDAISITRQKPSDYYVPFTGNGSIDNFCEENSYKFYIRLRVGDQKGVVAEIGNILANNDVSLNSIDQEAHSDNRDWEEEGEATLTLLTHQVTEAKFKKTVNQLKESKIIKKICCVLRVFE
ncbi:MAG: homoserine dehydrogenase [Candidatus Caenarcaniphilales bacterium]|nr:homoserine dehydrogenase [Candidatus Caenarcaniphilales bacterium]